MIQKNLKSLRRSISEKLLGVKKHGQSSSPMPIPKPEPEPGSSQSLADDPFKECLANYSDNVSHLVFYGSSLQSLSSYSINDDHRRSTHSHTSHGSTDSSDTTSSNATMASNLTDSSTDGLPTDEKMDKKMLAVTFA
ncbi:unnamed protein product, partial [Mesorhabditis spiculigera]